MHKIPTIFDRDFEGNRGVIDKVVKEIPLEDVYATEKLDGTNVRITVRNHTVVRVEKRRNPDKIQKQKGITEPWYVDASEFDTQDKWIYNGIKNTDFSEIGGGEYSGELIGKNIQGNPLNLEDNRIVFFQYGITPEVKVFEDCPTGFNELKEWLPKQKSKYGNDCGIEGIVWWFAGVPIGKIKIKDFK